MNDLEAVEFLHAPYAAVFSSQALHEITHDRKRAVYEKVFELLRPGGAFYILDRVDPRFDDLPAEYERVWNRLNRGDGCADERSVSIASATGIRMITPQAWMSMSRGLRMQALVAAPLYLHYNRALIAARRP